MQHFLPLAVSLVLAAPLAAAVDDQPLIDHRQLANELFARLAVDTSAGPEELTLGEVLDAHFVHARLGVLDLAMASQLTRDKRVAGRYLDTVRGMVSLQARFIELAAGGTKEAKAVLKDAAAVEDWLKKMRGDVLAAAKDTAGGDVFELLAPPAKVQESLDRFDAYMKSGAAIGLAREGVAPEVLILAPGRRDFHELLGLFGWLSPDLQGVYWHDGTIPWTNTYFNAVTVVALEYHSGDGARGEVFAGIDANGRNPTAMQQQVTQLAANSLVTNLYGERVPPALVGAMAINLVVDIYGECATRVDGDLRQRRTEAQEVFIPGGQSEGGMLPPNFANSRFRGEEGKDRFLVPLKSCQSAGATQAKQERKKGKIEHFQLWNDAQSGRYVVTAPLLGTPAAAQPPLPEAYHEDGAEFFRAYRTCFLWWLETEGGGSKKKSTELYASFLQRLAQLDSAAGLEEAIAEVYDMPLSSAEPGKKDLEGRFLTWLSKQ